MAYAFVTRDATSTQAVGEALAPLLVEGDVVLLTGDLGAGKTTLVRGIARGLGVAEETTSPTFNIMVVHPGRLTLYHVDLYRLDTAAQLEDIDYWGTLEAGGVTVVEWGDRFAEARPDQCLIVEIDIGGDEERRFTLAAEGERGIALRDGWIAACASVAGVERATSGGAS